MASFMVLCHKDLPVKFDSGFINCPLSQGTSCQSRPIMASFMDLLVKVKLVTFFSLLDRQIVASFMAPCHKELPVKVDS